MRNGYTLCELLTAAAILGALSAAALPSAIHLRNRAAVRATITTLRTTLSAARDAALTHSTPALLILDTARHSATILVGPDTILDQPLSPDDAASPTRLTASRDTVRFGPSGRAYGASNTTLIVRAGNAADTITVSRLGRVRSSTPE